MKTVSFLIVLLYSLGFSCQDETPEIKSTDRRYFHKECLEEIGISEEQLLKIWREDEDNQADDENGKCYYKCIYQKSGALDDDGNFSSGDITVYVSPNVDKANITAALRKCKELKTFDASCETVFKLTKCVNNVIKMIRQQN